MFIRFNQLWTIGDEPAWRFWGARIGLVICLAGAAVLLARTDAGRDLTVVNKPRHFTFRCTHCGYQWTADEHTVCDYFGGNFPSYTTKVVCPKCRKRQAFAMTPCPWCKQPYIPAYLLDDSDALPAQDICPHCGKNTLDWKR